MIWTTLRVSSAIALRKGAPKVRNLTDGVASTLTQPTEDRMQLQIGGANICLSCGWNEQK